MKYLKIGYAESSVTNKDYQFAIKVEQVGKTDYFVNVNSVNKPTMNETLKQTYCNRVYKIIGNKVIVGQLLDSKTFKKSIYHD